MTSPGGKLGSAVTSALDTCAFAACAALLREEEEAFFSSSEATIARCWRGGEWVTRERLQGRGGWSELQIQTILLSYASSGECTS